MTLGTSAASKVNKIIQQFKHCEQKMNNNPGQEVLINVKEHTRIGGAEVSKQTIIHATDDQLVFDIVFSLRVDPSSYDRCMR